MVRDDYTGWACPNAARHSRVQRTTVLPQHDTGQLSKMKQHHLQHALENHFLESSSCCGKFERYNIGPYFYGVPGASVIIFLVH